MYIRLTILTLLCFFSTNILSCDLLHGPSCEGINPFFEVVSTQQSVYLHPGDPVSTEGEAWQDLVFYHDALSRYVSCAPSFPSGVLFALDCHEQGYEGSKLGLRSLDIITLSDYNDTYQAGDTINDMLEFTEDSFREDGRYQYTYQEFMDWNDGVLRFEYFVYRLTQAPAASGLQAFEVCLEFDDGSRFCSTSPGVVVLQ